ncbi:MAG: FtsX-like permease family protein [Anaerolineales bacterium]
MFKTRMRKILGDVWSRKGRTALVSIAIFIGVAGTIALFSMSDIIVSQLREDIQEDELPMGQVFVSPEPDTRLDTLAMVRAVDDAPGVTEVMSGFSDTVVYFKTDPDNEDFEEGQALAAQVLDEDGGAFLSAPFQTELPMRPVRLVEGDYPEDPATQIVIEQRMAENYGLEIGDQLYFRILSPSRVPAENNATGTLEAFTITGLVLDPYSFSPRSAFYSSVETLNYITNLDGVSTIWLRFTDFETAQAEIDTVLELIATETTYNPDFSSLEDPAENALITQAALIGNLMGFLAVTALVVSGFLVINVISSLVVEQQRQIGVMKSMGATRTDNFFIYSGIALAYGIIGVVPGVLVGIPLGYFFAEGLSTQVNTILDGFQISPPSIILGVIIGLAVPVLASIIPVWNGTRVSILDAMTDLGIGGSYGKGPLARLIKALPLTPTIRQGLSNLSIKKSRMAFTVITLAIAVGTFMGIFAIFESLTSGISDFLDTWEVDVFVGPVEPQDPETFQAALANTFGDRLSAIEPGNQIQVEFEGFEVPATTGGPPGILVYAYDVFSDTPAFTYDVTEGEDLDVNNNWEDGVVLSSVLAFSMEKDVGDTVVMQLPGREAELRVVGIAEFPITQLWMHWETIAEINGSTLDVITSESPVPQDLIPPQASSFIRYVTLADTGDEGQALALGFTPSATQFLSFTAGGFPEDGDDLQVMVAQSTAEREGWEVGDVVMLGSTIEDGRQAMYELSGIFDAEMFAGAAGGDLPEDIIGMYWRDLTAFDAAQVESRPIPGAYLLSLDGADVTADDADSFIDDLNEFMIASGIPVFAFNFISLQNQIVDAFTIFQVILQAVALLIALVGALGLLTTLSMSVYERQKEIGVMRSIGAGSSTVAMQFLTEGLVVGVIAWVVGLPLMIFIQWAILNLLEFDETFPLEFSPVAAVVGLVGMLIITTIASLWPSISAARKTVSEILRYQ